MFHYNDDRGNWASAYSHKFARSAYASAGWIIMAALAAFCFSIPQAAIAGKDGGNAADTSFWRIEKERDSIVWNVAGKRDLPHGDHIEMAGEAVAAIITYDIDAGGIIHIKRAIFFPQLRVFKKWKYRAYLKKNYGDAILPAIVSDGKKVEPAPVDSIRINGMWTVRHKERDGLRMTRTFVPSMTERLFVEKWTIENVSDKPKKVEIGKVESNQTIKGTRGTYHVRVHSDAKPKTVIQPRGKYEFGVYFSTRLNDEPPIAQNFADVVKQRTNFLDHIRKNLVLKTPDPVLNTLFYFSKIRASESIYKSTMGLIHSPGGGRYYVGIWANDQCEYSGPFFPYLGYDIGNTAALNAYIVFEKHIPPEGGHLPPSFEMNGDIVARGCDRGDAAMTAFGASQFALARGDAEIAEKLWPLISWCLDYCEKMKNESGAVMSKSDEMEGRIPTGDANLATSSLYYGGLIYSARLADALGKEKKVVEDYRKRAAAMRKAIDNYFGAEIEGLKTYRYFKGHKYLRHWICLPLVMGINDRRKGTLDALFGKLWTPNGVRVELNPNQKDPGLFWDRGTLYAFNGAFKAGAADRALARLDSYSKTRLIGSHVPYVVEAWPEGDMAHLSAESALYCRIFTEGLLGISPTGFKSFRMTPRMPSKWNRYSIEHIRAFDSDFDVSVEKKNGKIRVEIRERGKILLDKTVGDGETIDVTLKSGHPKS